MSLIITKMSSKIIFSILDLSEKITVIKKANTKSVIKIIENLVSGVIKIYIDDTIIVSMSNRQIITVFNHEVKVIKLTVLSHILNKKTIKNLIKANASLSIAKPLSNTVIIRV